MVLLGACSSGPGDQNDLEQALLLSDGFTQEQAECFAEGLFDEYGDNDQALSLISSESFDELLETEATQLAELEVAEESGDADAVDSVATFLIGFEEFHGTLTSTCIG